MFFFYLSLNAILILVVNFVFYLSSVFLVKKKMEKKRHVPLLNNATF